MFQKLGKQRPCGDGPDAGHTAQQIMLAWRMAIGHQVEGLTGGLEAK